MKNLTDLKRRLSVSSITIVLVALLVGFSQNVAMKVVLTAVIALLSAVALWEYANLSFAKEIKIAKNTMMIFGVLQVIASYIAIQFPKYSLLSLMVIIVAGFFFFLAHFKNPSDALANVATGFFGVCYIAVPLSFMLEILYVQGSSLFPAYQMQDGRWWFIYLLLVTKITDVGAYFVGRLWGKHRLAPRLSPKKTVEGAIAGLAAAVFLSLAICLFAKRFFPEHFDISLLSALLLGSALGVFGQLGDLAESLFKRDADFKDSNKLPGLGGILDMVDSLLFTTPIVYCFLRLDLSRALL